MSDTDLSNLDIITDDQQTIKSHRITVQKVATHALTNGLQAKDRGQVSSEIPISQLTFKQFVNKE